MIYGTYTQNGEALNMFIQSINNKRDSQLDLIKVASRSDDQANSACNIVKSLYKHLNWLVQEQVGRYKRSNPDLEISDKKVNYDISRVARSLTLGDMSIDEDSSDYKKILEPIEYYLKNFHVYPAIITNAVGASSYPLPEGSKVEDCTSEIESLKYAIKHITVYNK